MWSAALLYYCAVKGKDMGFGELHKHLIKYVRCPAKRYWYVLTAVVAWSKRGGRHCVVHHLEKGLYTNNVLECFKA